MSSNPDAVIEEVKVEIPESLEAVEVPKCPYPATYDDYYASLEGLEYVYVHPFYNDVTVYHNYYDEENDRYTNAGSYDLESDYFVCNEYAEDAIIEP